MRDSLDSTTTRSQSLSCPFCEVYELKASGHDTARCYSCGGSLGGKLLKTLNQIVELPEVMGRHACDCGHPEMRHLPDGIFHCPACGSEVLPISRSS